MMIKKEIDMIYTIVYLIFCIILLIMTIKFLKEFGSCEIKDDLSDIMHKILNDKEPDEK